MRSSATKTSCYCRQDIIRDHDGCMFPGDDGRCLFTAIRNLALAGQSIGLSIDSMIDLLNGGMSLPELFDYISTRYCGPVQ